MGSRDRPQQYILIAMVILAVLMVAGVFMERKKARQGGVGVPRVSLHAAPPGDAGNVDSAFILARPLDLAKVAPAHRFDFPLGSEHGAMSYNAQPFQENGHLGADLNGIGGWDSDRGDAVYAAAAGRVVFAGWPSEGWGNLVILAHRLPGGKRVQSVYAHLERISVAVDDDVPRGREIGTVGKGAGQYLAHLHFEVRENSTLNPGAGYADGPLDRIAPAEFLAESRGAGPERLNPAPGFSGSQGGEERGPGVEIRLPDEGKTVRELRQ